MDYQRGWLLTALANIRQDPQWWRTLLLGGACMLTLLGWPLASGLVVESLDNSRKGFPTPLPPWYDLGTRYFIGLFGLLIDFVLFMLPLFVGGALLVCIMIGVLFAGAQQTTARGNSDFALFVGALLVLIGCVELFIFLSSAAPVARLMYVDEGRIEEALGAAPLRRALSVPARSIYVRARIASLPAYLPALLLTVALWGLAQWSFPGLFLVLLALLWLLCSALLFAHLVVVQIYALAEKEVHYALLRVHMPQ